MKERLTAGERQRSPPRSGGSRTQWVPGEAGGAAPTRHQPPPQAFGPGLRGGGARGMHWEGRVRNRSCLLMLEEGTILKVGKGWGLTSPLQKGNRVA